MTPDLSTSVGGGVTLANPVMVASGTFGYAQEFEGLLDLGRLGGMVTKTLTLKPRPGNPPQRIVETASGMLNAIGLQNVGAAAFLSDKLPYLRSLGVPLIASVMGNSEEELMAVVQVLEDGDPDGALVGYELNLSCPNVAYGRTMFAHAPDLTADAVRAVRGVTERLVVAKLSPEVTDITPIARAAEDAGADALALINTYPAMVIDVDRRRPVLANRTGGLSGPCIRPIAVRLVYDAAQAVVIPVIGIGGIVTARDALEFVLAGAAAVQIGTISFVNPGAAIEVLEGILEYMQLSGTDRFSQLVGAAVQ